MTKEEITDASCCDIGNASNCSTLTIELIKEAIKNAARGHSNKREVRSMLKMIDLYAKKILESIESGSYIEKLKYRQLVKVSSKGKVRHIDSPSLFTRVLQHIFILLILPLYEKHDNFNGLNCKTGCGITARNKSNSVVHRLKRVYYDRRDLNYAVVIDQRKCYEHISKKLVRKALKRLTRNKWLIDFGVNLVFCDSRFPIGTPTSPLIQHIVCLEFDHWIKNNSPFSIRYADNCFIATYTKEDAQQLLWRVKNFWWYRLGIRSKKGESRVVPLDIPLDFCGYVFHRNSLKTVSEHNKGYTTVRKRILKSACRSNRNNYSAYFGLLKHADSFKKLLAIEEGMKLQELTKTIRITRDMDAPNIHPSSLLGVRFTVYDYEIRRDNKGVPNWIKLLIGVEEIAESSGEATGKILAYELHGAYTYLINFISECEKVYSKAELLPLEEMELVQSCGYIFKGSTNQINYINDNNVKY